MIGTVSNGGEKSWGTRTAKEIFEDVRAIFTDLWTMDVRPNSILVPFGAYWTAFQRQRVMRWMCNRKRRRPAFARAWGRCK